MNDLPKKVEHTILEHGLIKAGDKILVALSGGPDSVALLHLLRLLAFKYSLRISAAHLDHSIRPNSYRDREFCRVLCRSLKIKLHSKRLDVVGIAGKRRLSVEEAGRDVRYAYLGRLADKLRYNRIATGHTLDDNVETVVMNLVRGSGLTGLAGIPYKRGQIIRPLLECSKAELESYLRSNKVAFVKDTSNRSLRYARNRVRLNIFPEMEKLNPAAKINIARMAKNVRDDVEFLSDLTVSAYNEALIETGKAKILLDLAKLQSYDKSLRKKVLEEAFKRQSGKKAGLTSESLARALDAVDGKSGGMAPLADGYCIQNSQGRIGIFHKTPGHGKTDLVIPGTTQLPDSLTCLDSRIVSKEEIRGFDRTNRTAYLDFQRLGDVAVRFWEKGDRIKPLGMEGHRLLSDIFIDNKVPEFERDSVPLVVSGDRIAWVAGIMVSDDFKILPSTEEVLKIELCKP